MLSRLNRVGVLAALAVLVVPAYQSVNAAEGGRQIEEVIVTAERRESSVQDTAISITAFTGEFIEDFGIRNQEDLQNYIPATTIQPYDLSIRGVGRLFRALGGDPGVATYFDGAYSEDFGIASTEGGLFDLERIEVLRGPQGTLYGRNGIGGAVNFHSKRPTDEFEGEVKVIAGNYDTREIFGVLSGPLIPGVLNARATGVKRTRDGFVDEKTPGESDINDYGDENYTLALEWTPTENLTIWGRGNERSYRRKMSGAQGAGSIIVSENGGIPDPVTGEKRWTSVPVQGWRTVQGPGGVECASATDRTVADCNVPTGIVPYINGANPFYEFELNGEVRYGQPLVAGVDSAGLSADGTSTTGFATSNYAYQATTPEDFQRLETTTIGNGREIPELEGSDLKTFTNGFNDEYFDHQAGYLNITWDLRDNITLKYIGAYTDYFYDRSTEDDRTGFTHDSLFYAAQENENFQHEVQAFIDFSENLTLTSGFFYYENDIDQQLDFYSTDSWSKYTEPFDYGPAGADAYLSGDPTAFLYTGSSSMVNHRSAQNLGKAGDVPNLAGAIAIPSFSDPTINEVYFADSAWLGDNFGTTGRVDHGPTSDGTTFIWDTENRTKAWAVYAQGEWQINDLFALTLGLRYAKDEKEAEENLFLYNETRTGTATCAASDAGAAACGDGDGDGIVTLSEFNQNITGSIDATGNLTDFDNARYSGVPYARSIYRSLDQDYDKVTWRVNFDYTPTEDDLIYASVTTGYRAGGFNLGYFSFEPTYNPEEITSYEIGYKGTMFDGTFQLNASAYYYDYDKVHLQFSQFSFTGTSTSVTNAPSARTYGFEGDILWLATDNLTFGLNYSYTNAEYDEELFNPTNGQTGVVSDSDPYAPSAIYTVAEREFPIDGEPLPRIPKNKATGWAEYTFNLGDLGTLVTMSTLAYTDEFQAAGRPVPENPLSVAPEYWRWDARTSWTNVKQNWNVSAFINNITDDVGVRNQFTYAAIEGHRRVIEPTNPRMFGLEVQYKFGAFQ